MRVYGRDPSTGQWLEMHTDANGHDDYVYLVGLVQCLKLNINESPFWADWGIPASQSVVQQIFPDFYVALIQQRYSTYFASLQISKISSTSPKYQINVVTNQGVSMEVTVPV